MNVIKSLLLVSLLGLLGACQDDDVKKPLVLPQSAQTGDQEYNLIYNSENKLGSVNIINKYPNDVVLTTEHTFIYDGDILKECVVDNGYRMVYTYDGGRIVRTDEYIGEHFTQYYSFTYNAKGLTEEIITWQDIPEYGGVVPVQKGVYLYDENDNVINQQIRIYNTQTKAHDLLTQFVYSDYDNHPSVDDMFVINFVNPFFNLSKNNPGKMVSSNGNNLGTMEHFFTYQYDSRGNVSSRTIQGKLLSTGQITTMNTQFTYLLK